MGAPIMRVEARRQSNDCAVWALSTYLGIPYDEVWQTVVKLDRSKGKNGLHTATIRRISKALGRPLQRFSALRVSDDSYGVLIVTDDENDGHAVVVRNGLVFDTDTTVWDLPAWLECRKARIDDLLTEEAA
jgi:hypothetical protein